MKRKFLSAIMILCIGSIVFAQQTVSGVVNGNGDPLPGATVIEKGTNNGVSTDFDGNFSITVSNSDAVLINIIY